MSDDHIEFIVDRHLALGFSLSTVHQLGSSGVRFRALELG